MEPDPTGDPWPDGHEPAPPDPTGHTLRGRYLQIRTTPGHIGPEAKGLGFTPHFCTADDPYAAVTWADYTAEVKDDQGQVLWRQEGCRFPASFSQQAANIVASKYFFGDIHHGDDPAAGGREHDFALLVDRIVDTITSWGTLDGYFATTDAALTFGNELAAILLGQYACFNSPVLFNAGVFHKYGAAGDSDGYRWDPDGAAAVGIIPGESYKYPQISACFILGVADNMESILDRAKAEGVIFKYGSGAGSDNSPLRSSRERLSGGGRPSGPVSFMRIYDSVGAVIKSGGKNRRAAKMEILRCDHPDIEEFIDCKPASERMAHALIDAGWPADYNSVVYWSLPYQNSNLSVRATDEFLRKAAGEDQDPIFQTRAVTTGRPDDDHGVRMPALDARAVLQKVAEGTWLCGDPGLQYDTTIQHWHTCPQSGMIRSTNPCAEYCFLDNTACNLASINLLKFRTPEGGFDVEGYGRACQVVITAQEIMVDHAGYPTAKIAENSHAFRPLGLGYTNLGALIMSYGLAYDSDAARALCGCLTAILHGRANLQSAMMAREFGPFDGFAVNRADMLRVMGQHRDALAQIPPPTGATAAVASMITDLRAAAARIWDAVIACGERYGFRNSQVTVLAPAGTISYVMDADTTGIEPDIALVKYKKLAGGGTMKIVNRTVPLALKTLGYEPHQVDQIVMHIEKHDTIEDVTPENGITLHSGLKPEHLPVFDCAFRAARGTRSIHWRGHVGMMSVAQLFISGSISKTVNVNNDCSVEKIEEVYLAGWKAGLKAIAIYRDGCKRSQPLNTKQDAPAAASGPLSDEIDAKAASWGLADRTDEPAAAVPVVQPRREKLPRQCRAERIGFKVGQHKGYIHVGFYEDGRIGEIFLTGAREGSTVSGLLDVIATLTSIALQYGVPLEELVGKFSFTRFEPSGFTNDDDVRIATSIPDFVFRKLGCLYLTGYRAAHAPAHTTIVAPAGPPPAPYQSDAPPCPNCHNIMTRRGACYVCGNCGETSGCG